MLGSEEGTKTGMKRPIKVIEVNKPIKKNDNLSGTVPGYNPGNSEQPVSLNLSQNMIVNFLEENR